MALIGTLTNLNVTAERRGWESALINHISPRMSDKTSASWQRNSADRFRESWARCALGLAQVVWRKGGSVSDFVLVSVEPGSQLFVGQVTRRGISGLGIAGLAISGLLGYKLVIVARFRY